MINLQKIEGIISELNSSNSSTHKIKTLQKYKDDKDLQTILYHTYNPYLQYFVTPETLEKLYNDDLKVNANIKFVNLIDMLESLAKRNVTGHTAITSVNDFVFDNETHKDLIYNIIGKDLKCRISEKTINKVWKGLIPTFDVALGVNIDKVGLPDLSESWLISRKLDGVRCIERVDNMAVTSWSRQGNQFNSLFLIEQEIQKFCKIYKLDNIVLDGECCIVKNDLEDFQGVMKEIRRKNHTIKNPRFYIFDCLTIEEFESKTSKRKLSERHAWLKSKIKEFNSPYLVFLEQELLTAESFDRYSKDIAKYGWEGSIIRKDTKYIGKRSKDILKVKTFKDAEYTVISTENGPFRHIINGKEHVEDMMSNVYIMHKGNQVSVGTGFSIEERQHYYLNPNDIIGKVITVKYFAESKNQSGQYSLRFPTCKFIHGNARTV